MIKEVHLHEDAIKHQEHHSTDSFRNPATLGTALNTYISVDPFWSLKEGKFQCGMRIMVKSSRIKSEIKLGYRRKWICANKEETEV